MTKTASRKQKIGDTVRCLFGDVSYPARILQIDESKKAPYFVHYLQWKSRWDEWVSVDRITTAELSPIALKKLSKKLQGAPKTSTPINKPEKAIVKKTASNSSVSVKSTDCAKNVGKVKRTADPLAKASSPVLNKKLSKRIS